MLVGFLVIGHRGGQVHVKTVSQNGGFWKKILSQVCQKYWLFYLADLLWPK